MTPAAIENFLRSIPKENVLELERQLMSLEDSREKYALIHYRPHAKQAIFDKLFQSHIETFMFGGNGSGKTIHGAKTTACYLLGEDPSGTTSNDLYPKPERMHTGRKIFTQGYFGCTRIDKGIKIIKQDLIPLLPEGFITKKPSINDPTLETKLGTGLTIMSYKADDEQWQSDSLDFVWFDEQPPYAKYKEALSRILRRKGRVWCTMTPIYAKSAWTYWEIVRNKRGNPNCSYVTVDIMDNDYLDDEIKQNYITSYKGTKEEQARLHGKHTLMMGVIHADQWKPDKHVIEPFELNDPIVREEFELVRVMDLHPRNPNVCQWFLVRRAPKPVIYQIKELSMKGVHIKLFGENVKRITEEIGMIPKVTIIDTPDARDENQLGTSLRMELAKIKENGKSMSGIPANRSIMSGIMRFGEYLEQDRFMIFKDSVDKASNVEEDTVFSIESYRWDEWKGSNADEKEPKEKPIGEDDHWVRNCHYLCLWMPALKEDLDNNTLKGVDNNAVCRYDSPIRNYQMC